MANLKRIFTKSEEPAKESLPTEKKDSGVALCECGQPVAVELGQTSVCAKHIRVG